MTPIDSREPKPGEPPPSSSRAEFWTLVAAGMVAGIACALLDAFLTRAEGATIGLPIIAHAAAIGALAGFPIGLVVAAIVALSSAIGRSGAPRFLAFAPAVILAIAVFVPLTLPLFRGAWISAQTWASVAKWGWIVTGSLLIVAACWAVRRAAARRGTARFRAAIAGAAIAAVATWVNLSRFGAYPTLKWQLTAVAFLFLIAAVRLLWPRAGLPRWLAIATCLGLVAVATTGAVIQRRQPSIQGIRSAIIGTPFPIVSRLIIPIEDGFLSFLGSPPSRAGLAINALPALAPVFDKDAVTRDLDALVPDRRNLDILLIALDALRADHLSCEGYPRATTPRLDAFARQASWFRRAVSPVPSSSMGYSSTMTGLYARITPAYAAEFGAKFPVPKQFSLASRLKAGGYQTLGFTAFFGSVASQPQFQVLAEGFDEWNAGGRGEELVAAQVTGQALAALSKKRKPGAPLMMFLHYMEPHAPYYLHPEHDFGRKPIDAYDGEVALADASVGQILDELERSGDAKKTIVAIFGDHGEGFGEHNNREHGASLHDHQVRVPLLVRVPGIPPRAINQWVGLPDLPVTLMRIVDAPDPYPRLGRDLVPLMLGASGTWPDVAYAERAAGVDENPPSWERAVWHGDKKLMWRPHQDTVEVYDLARDPLELENVYEPGKAEHDQLFALLRGFDRLIDGYWQGTLAEPTPSSTLVQRFAAAVDRAVLSPTDPAAEKALSDLLSLLDSPGVYKQSAERRRLGEPSLVKLREWLLRRIPALPGDAASRSLGLRLLVFDDEPSTDAFLVSEIPKTTNREVVLDMLLALARHGRREAFDMLVTGFETAPVDPRILCAGGLALLGDGRGKDLLTMVLSRNWVEGLEGSILGLGKLGDSTALARSLVSSRSVWKHPRIERALLTAASAARSPTANAVLLRLSASDQETVAKEARDELAKRFPEADLVLARACRETFAGAENALLYRNPKLALEFLRTAGPKDDPWTGYAWWTVFRVAWEVGAKDVAAAALTRLGAAAPEIPGPPLPPARASRSPGTPTSASAGFDQPETRVDGTHVTATPDGEPVMPFRTPREAFFARMKVTNSGQTYIPGGEWPTGVRLRWRFADLFGAEVLAPDDPGTSLPDAGLAPGESVTIGVLGRLPDSAARFKVQLVATLGDDAGPAVMQLTPEVAITVERKP